MNRMRWTALIFVVSCAYAGYMHTHASLLLQVRDLISTSAPSAAATHTIEFTLGQTIPVSGTIILSFPSEITIPSGVSYEDVDFAVSTGGPFSERVLAATAGAADGVAVSGQTITITLNATTEITAGSIVRIRIGTNAVVDATGDVSLINPSAPGSYRVNIETRGPMLLDRGQTILAIVAPVTGSAQNLNVPPTRLNGLPSGVIAAGSDRVEISLETNELASCQYSLTPGVAYSAMALSMQSVGDLLFYAVTEGHVDDTTYTYYVRCRDYYGVVNTDDYEITFTLDESPISDTSQRRSGGGGQGGVGTIFGGSRVLYLSSLVLSGTTSPGGSVTFLVDGRQAAATRASQSGAFNGQFQNLERGNYTFSSYARDTAGRVSSSYSATMSLGQGTTNTISGVLLPPTIEVSSRTLKIGEPLKITGEAAASSTVEVQLRMARVPVKKYSTPADERGVWHTEIPANDLARGAYDVYARTILGNVMSDFTAAPPVGIGEEPAFDGASRTDINGDEKVNLVDFSILLTFWGTSNAGADINGDGTVDLADFSIMLFNWTG